MPDIRVNAKGIGAAIVKEIEARIRATDFSGVLVSQATRRVENAGDSQFRYPGLWADGIPGHYRAGGSPLLDTGKLVNGLHASQDEKDGRFVVHLFTNELYGVYHQSGFTTKGPNFIPLTIDARDRYPEFASITARGKDFVVEAEKRGFFRSGPKQNYIMAWQGVDVPQRKIANMPPENVAEIRDTILEAIRKAA